MSNGLPSPAATALVTRFAAARLEQTLLDTIIKTGLVPQCAMKVQRATEIGPLQAYEAPVQCHCYFQATVPQGAAGRPIAGDAVARGCPTDRPACNLGYCEKQ